ncbi:unnamed protein product, partial [Oikopleura dioica]
NLYENITSFECFLAMSKKTGNYEKTCSASTSAGIPSPILDPLAEDLDYPDSEVAWRNARRIDNPYQGLFRQVPLESVGQDIVAEVMNGKMTEWDRKYQNRMIPLVPPHFSLFKIYSRTEDNTKKYSEQIIKEQAALNDLAEKAEQIRRAIQQQQQA